MQMAPSSVRGEKHRRDVNRRVSGVITLLMGVVVSSTLGLGTVGDPVVSAANTVAPQMNDVNVTSDTPISAQSATPVWTNTAVTAVSAGYSHTCAIQGSPGVLFCWGSDQYGQLGNGTTTGNQPRPVLVSPNGDFANSGVTHVDAGGEYTCAVEDGEVFCWGRRNVGVLGDQSNTGFLALPTKVPDNSPNHPGWNSGITRVIAQNQNTCALKGQSSELYCWGINNAGQLGIGTVGDTSTFFKAQKVLPGDMTNSDVLGVAMSSGTVCALRAGSLHCWGSRELGLSLTATNSGSPLTAPTLGLAPAMANSSVDSVVGNTSHFCALKSTRVYCWGANTSTRRAVGTASTTDPILEPTIVSDGEMVNSNVTSIAVGGFTSSAFSCALKGQAAELYCWGNNSQNQLGTTAASPQASPVKVSDGAMINSGVSAMSLGGEHACAIKSGGVYCWGQQTSGQLGNSVTSGLQSSPVEVAAIATLAPATQTVSGVVGSSVASSPFTATGFSGQMTYTVPQGSLPDGVTISASTGAISGTPTATSSATVTITGTGATSGTATATITFAITEPALTPTFGPITQTADGFTVNVTNHDANFTWLPTSSAGSVSAGTANGAILPLTVTGLTPGQSATVTLATTRANYANGSAQVSSSALNTALTPSLGTPTRTADGFTVGITNYDATFDWSVSGVTGSIDGTGLLTVTGVSPGASATATVTTERSGYASGTATVTASALAAARVPTFDAPVATADGFTVNVTNHDAAWTWPAPTSDAGSVTVGTISGSTMPLTVTGLTSGASATITVTTTRAGYADGSGTLTSAAIGPPSLTPSTQTVSGTANSAITASTSLTPLNFGGAVTYSVTNGSLPTGLQFDQSTGVVFGTPSAASSVTITITGTAGAQTATVTITFNIAAANVVAQPTPPASTPPAAPVTPEGPSPVTPPTPGQAPSLISIDDALQLEQQPGQAGALVNGSPVVGEVEAITSPAASVPPAQRSPEQVQEIQQAAARLIEAFNESLPANTGPLVTITNTDTGAVLNGLLVDPRDGVTPIAIPVENLVMMTIGESKVLLVGASPTGEPLDVVDGVLQVGPGGVLSIVLSGLPANARGEAVLFSDPILLGSFVTSEDGTFAGQFAVPANVTEGSHTLVVAVEDTTISIGVQATEPESQLPPGTLPVTGDGRSDALLVAAMWLLVFGVLAGAARRRNWVH